MTASVKAVAHVTWSGEVGGIERLVRDLAAQQVRDGLAVTVAFGQVRGPFVDEMRRAGARVVDLHLRSGWDLGSSRIIRGAAELRLADVIHMHGFNLALAALAEWTRRPIVFTEHGNFGLGRRIGARGKVKRHLQGSFLRHRVAGLAANSAHTGQRAGALYGLDTTRLEVIHNGIDPSWFDKDVFASANDRAGNLRIATVGRLVAFKRVDRAIEAIARASLRDRMQLTVVGRGPLEGQLHTLATSLGIDARVRFVGDRTDVARTLAATDVLIHPSENEPFGLAILEACAKGVLPVVFSDGGGALEVIPPDGAVVDGIDSLAAVLDELVEAAPALSRDARTRRGEWVRERFPIARTAQAYADLYERAAR